MKTNQLVRSLHCEFVRLGKMKNDLTHQLQALIPEINKLRIWEKEGYQSVYHYAAILAGLSPGVVDKVLRVEKNLEGKPHLKEAVKTEGIHKVAMIARIATSKNEKEMAAIVRGASKRAVQEYARELRRGENGPKKVGEKVEKVRIELDDEMQRMFFRLKKKLGDKLSNKEVMRRILREVEGGEEEGRERENFLGERDATERSLILPGKKIEKRYIPAVQKRFILKKYQNSCSYPGCNKPHDVLHHRERFGRTKNHQSVIPLCEIHHEFAHSGLIRHEQRDPEKWELRKTRHQQFEDVLYQNYKS